MITYKLLEKYKEIAHFCTSREGGASVGNFASNNLSPFTGDEPSHFAENKKALCGKLDIPFDKMVIPYQTHGTDIIKVTDAFFSLSQKQRVDALNGIDAIITNVSDVCIGITTADCVPLLFFDPERKVIAAAHAGWRGTCARIAEKVVRRMVDTYYCTTENILVCIGPSISVDSYNVGEELISYFEKEQFDTNEIFQRRDEDLYLDLWTANKQSLLQTGILNENIEVSGQCTYINHERFFSARRLGIKSGRMMSGIMLKK